LKNYEKAMQSLQKIRRYEFFLIFISITIYVVRRLFQENDMFNIERIVFENTNPTTKYIWQNPKEYSSLANTILPIVSGAILFFAAWYIFHYLVYPRIKEKDFSRQTYLFLALSILLAFFSVFIFNYFKIYYRYKHDSLGNLIGVKFYSYFRKLYLLTDTIAILVIILFYEVFAQFYYFIHKKLKDEKEENYQYLDYFLVGSITLLLLSISFFGHIPQKDLWFGMVRKLSMTGISMLTFYLAHNYFYKKVFPYISNIHSKEFSKGITIFLIVNGLGATFLSLVETLSWKNQHQVPFGVHIGAILMVFFVFVFISVFMSFIRKYLTKEKLQLKTQVVSKSAELSSLRSQINPHFLFNALNTLYSVSLKEKADLTSNGIQKLGDMMRFMLNENHQDRIPLSKEIEYLNNYIDIQRMRIDENHNIEIKINIQNSEREIFISPMLLNPFVENAFKHGISFRNPSWIYITLTHDAQKLYFKVHNSLHPKQENSPEEANNGIGLENVKKRLDLIYPNRHTLDIQASDNDYFVSLIIGIY
jgi:two-component system LytT family sensor kinase